MIKHICLPGHTPWLPPYQEAIEMGLDVLEAAGTSNLSPMSFQPLALIIYIHTYTHLFIYIYTYAYSFLWLAHRCMHMAAPSAARLGGIGKVSILDPALLPPYMIGWGDHQQCGPSGNVTRRLSNSSRKTLLSVPFHSLDTCLTVCLSG